MNNKKKILAIVLVALVLILGGASIYVATQLSTRQAVAPTAPESKPAASESATIVWSDSCAATASAVAVAEKTTTIEGVKTAYENETTNTAGSYSLKTAMDTVAKSQTYVYAISLKNTGEATATGVTIKDSLAEITELTYVDKVSGCSWSVAEKLVTCSTTINPDETKTFSFRVKTSSDVVNGAVITNTAAVTSDNAGSLTLTEDLPVSTVVGCNHTCTTDEECGSGLTCDTTTNKCRLAACLTESDCVCATVTTTTTTTVVTASPTKIATTAATPTILPETGILDLPGIAAFGGGLLLAVVGILLAL